MINKEIPELIVSENSKKYRGEPICVNGPPGAGKSTIGRKIAEKLSIPFYDLDELVNEKYGVKTSRELIQEKGIELFRKLSYICLKETLEKKKGAYVLGLNGGALVHLEKGDFKDKNKELVEKYAFTICLLPSKDISKSIEVLWPRQEDSKRLTGINSPEDFQLYMKKRIVGYHESADLMVYTHHASIEKIVSAILEFPKTELNIQAR